MLLKLLTVFFFLFLSIATVAAGPGDAGGGGSVVRCSKASEWALLDIANSDPLRAKKNNNEADSAESGSSSNKVEAFSVQKTDAYKLAQNKLEKWRENSPQLVAMIEKAMNRVPYFKVDSKLKLLPQYTVSNELKSQCPSHELAMAILFLPKYGAFVAEPLWSKLNTETQAGLLIHEALRQVQINYQYNTANADLEGITAQILLGEPKSNARLQESSFIKGRFRNYFQAWGTYRNVTGQSSLDADASCDQRSDASAIAAAFSLAVSFNEDLNDAIDRAQMQRAAAKSSEQLWRELLERKVLEP